MQLMNVGSQGFPVVEIIVGSNEAVGINALVDVVIRTVFDKGNTDITGNLKRGSPGRGQLPDDAAAAAGSLSQQRHPSVFLEGPGDQVTAGEREWGNQAEQVQAGYAVRFIKPMIQIEIRPIRNR